MSDGSADPTTDSPEQRRGVARPGVVGVIAFAGTAAALGPPGPASAARPGISGHVSTAVRDVAGDASSRAVPAASAPAVAAGWTR